MAEDLVVGFTTTESLKRCFSQVGSNLELTAFQFICLYQPEITLGSGYLSKIGTVPQTVIPINLSIVEEGCHKTLRDNLALGHKEDRANGLVISFFVSCRLFTRLVLSVLLLDSRTRPQRLLSRPHPPPSPNRTSRKRCVICSHGVKRVFVGYICHILIDSSFEQYLLLDVLLSSNLILSVKETYTCTLFQHIMTSWFILITINRRSPKQPRLNGNLFFSSYLYVVLVVTCC